MGAGRGSPLRNKSPRRDGSSSPNMRSYTENTMGSF